MIWYFSYIFIFYYLDICFLDFIYLIQFFYVLYMHFFYFIDPLVQQMWVGVSECACSTSGDISLNHLSFKNFQFGHISILGNSCCFATELNHYWFFFYACGYE